jgi:predicted small lipoprotein YifL
MKRLSQIISLMALLVMFIIGGCSQRGCPSNPSAGKGKPSKEGDTQQRLFNKDMR